MTGHVLAIDQGTTSTRAIVFDGAFDARGWRSKSLRSTSGSPAVEHDPGRDLERHDHGRKTTARAGFTRCDLAAIGITNQRETVVIWERATGLIHRAIVWQTGAPTSAKLLADGAQPLITERTGLIDPFSASKVAWLLDHVEGACAPLRPACSRSKPSIRFCCGGSPAARVHATDATNASRTQLFDIRAQVWDEDLLKLFIPRAAAGGSRLRGRFGPRTLLFALGSRSAVLLAISRSPLSARPVSIRDVKSTRAVGFALS